jgi:hypothetical protein
MTAVCAPAVFMVGRKGVSRRPWHHRPKTGATASNDTTESTHNDADVESSPGSIDGPDSARLGKGSSRGSSIPARAKISAGARAKAIKLYAEFDAISPERRAARERARERTERNARFKSECRAAVAQLRHQLGAAAARSPSPPMAATLEDLSLSAARRDSSWRPEGGPGVRPASIDGFIMCDRPTSWEGLKLREVVASPRACRAHSTGDAQQEDRLARLDQLSKELELAIGATGGSGTGSRSKSRPPKLYGCHALPHRGSSPGSPAGDTCSRREEEAKNERRVERRRANDPRRILGRSAAVGSGSAGADAAKRHRRHRIPRSGHQARPEGLTALEAEYARAHCDDVADVEKRMYISTRAAAHV